jgi:N-acetylmuramoyl-L-alanine amidase
MSKIIAVDDGHGLETAGKRSPDGYKENIFNHYTKEYLKIELIAQSFKIVDCSPTRSDNSLQDRCNRANNGNADIFVSIHFNAMGNKWQSGAEGIETYYHGGSTKGKKLATCVHKRLMQGTRMNNRGIKADTTIYTSGFAVLRNTKMPAILPECGFMDNKEDIILMKSIDYRKECAKEICQGICDYFGISYKNKSVYSDSAILKYGYDKDWYQGKNYKENDNVTWEKLVWVLKQFDENYLNKKFQKR